MGEAEFATEGVATILGQRRLERACVCVMSRPAPGEMMMTEGMRTRGDVGHGGAGAAGDAKGRRRLDRRRFACGTAKTASVRMYVCFFFVSFFWRETCVFGAIGLVDGILFSASFIRPKIALTFSVSSVHTGRGC